jgi:hypothetical protein
MEEKIEASEILRHWSTVVYGYAAELQGVQEHSLSWTPCDRLVAAAHDFWLAKGRAIGDLLTESQKVLGFEDPLTLRFDLHRWLAADREEAYSDWLAWIANELALPELVGRLLLGNDIPVEPGPQQAIASTKPWSTRPLPAENSQLMSEGQQL